MTFASAVSADTASPTAPMHAESPQLLPMPS